MKFKENVKINANDFWYDLTRSGYIKPEELLQDEADIEKINNAVKVLYDFELEMYDKNLVEEC